MADSSVTSGGDGEQLEESILQGLLQAMSPDDRQAAFAYVAEVQASLLQGLQDEWESIEEFSDRLYKQAEYGLSIFRSIRDRALQTKGQFAELKTLPYKHISVEQLDRLADVTRKACMPLPGNSMTEEQAKVVSNMLDKIDKLRDLLEHDQETRKKFAKLHKLAKQESDLAYSFSMMQAVLAIGCLLAAAALTAITILSGGTALIPILAVLYVSGAAMGGGSLFDFKSSLKMTALDEKNTDKYLQHAATCRAEITSLTLGIKDDIGCVVAGFVEEVEQIEEQFEELDLRRFAQNEGELVGLLDNNDAHSDAHGGYDFSSLPRRPQSSILSRYGSQDIMRQQRDNQQQRSAVQAHSMSSSSMHEEEVDVYDPDTDNKQVPLAPHSDESIVAGMENLTPFSSADDPNRIDVVEIIFSDDSDDGFEPPPTPTINRSKSSPK